MLSVCQVLEGKTRVFQEAAIWNAMSGVTLLAIALYCNKKEKYINILITSVNTVVMTLIKITL